MAVGRIDPDGRPDIVTGASTGVIRWYRAPTPVPALPPLALGALAALLVAAARRALGRR